MVSTTLTVGGVSDTFTSTTRTLDSIPDPFSFVDQTGVPLATVITSAVVVLSGYDVNVPVSITGGSYSVGCSSQLYGQYRHRGARSKNLRAAHVRVARWRGDQHGADRGWCQRHFLQHHDIGRCESDAVFLRRPGRGRFVRANHLGAGDDPGYRYFLANHRHRW